MPAHFTVGATADSGYEYFLKQYLLTGDQRAKAQCTSPSSLRGATLQRAPRSDIDGGDHQQPPVRHAKTIFAPRDRYVAWLRIIQIRASLLLSLRAVRARCAHDTGG